MQISLDAEVVSEIARAPWATNQYGSAEMITLTYRRRWTGKPHPSVSYLDEDNSVWEGDTARWDTALQRHLMSDLKPGKFRSMNFANAIAAATSSSSSGE